MSTRGRRHQGPILPTTTQRSSREYRRSKTTDKDGGYLSGDMRGHFVAMCGEFVGTTSFLWFALSATQIANNIMPPGSNDPGQLFYIAVAFGFSLAVNAWVFYRVSGGLFNPAVTLGLCAAGGIPWFRGGLLFIAQMLAGMVASALVSAMFPGPMYVQTTLGHGTSIVQGLFIEMFLTFLLVITILFLAVEKWKATFIAPVGIGLALFVAELSGVYFTGGSLNPTRSFGPNVVLRDFQSYHWIYWLGPCLGALMAAGYYHFMKWMDYEDANPGQDATHPSEQAMAERKSRSRRESGGNSR